MRCAPGVRCNFLGYKPPIVGFHVSVQESMNHHSPSKKEFSGFSWVALGGGSL